MELFTFVIEEKTAERDKFLREVCDRYYYWEPLWEGKKLFSFKYIK